MESEGYPISDSSVWAKVGRWPRALQEGFAVMAVGRVGRHQGQCQCLGLNGTTCWLSALAVPGPEPASHHPSLGVWATHCVFPVTCPGLAAESPVRQPGPPSTASSGPPEILPQSARPVKLPVHLKGPDLAGRGRGPQGGPRGGGSGLAGAAPLQAAVLACRDKPASSRPPSQAQMLPAPDLSPHC